MAAAGVLTMHLAVIAFNVVGFVSGHAGAWHRWHFARVVRCARGGGRLQHLIATRETRVPAIISAFGSDSVK